MLSADRRSRILLLGDSGVGKSQLMLTSSEGSTVDGSRPTSGIQIATVTRAVSLDPTRPHGNDSTKDVSMTLYERGDAPGLRSEHSQARLQTTFDVVVLMFDGRKHASYENLWKRWSKMIAEKTACSTMVPFVTVVETHADSLHPNTLLRHRRVIEIDLYFAFGGRFIYQQLDTRKRSDCDHLWNQVAIQLRWQFHAERGTIHVVEPLFLDDNPHPRASRRSWYDWILETGSDLWQRIRHGAPALIVDLEEGDFEML